jgi:2-polyprenyl-6-methoxyphenol hydroxylase-like FAD-dependent oxidoreductase
MPALPAETDVLVVGAGPAGLALAASLTQLGVGHMLIDRNNGIQPGTKAAAIQPATLEYLDRLGVAVGLVAVGLKGQGFRLRAGQRTLLRIPYDDLDTPFPYLLLISQQVTEEHLAHHLAEKGGTIHRGHRLIGFTPDFPGVTAMIAAPDGMVRAVQVRYLIGCDGVHSRVRTTAGISFPGHAREQLYALAEFRPNGGPPDAEDSDTTNYISPNGMLLTTPLAGGLFRVVASVPPGSAPPTAADVQALLDTRGPGTGTQRVAEIIDASTYRAQERVADRMSDGPVFLAGDAAHTHSPAGGQGMNTGIQDVANLAWKLHAVLTGAAPEALLDTYHRERHPVAASLVAFTSQLADLVTAADPASASLRNDIIAAVATAPGLTGWLASRLSQLDISYPAPAAAPADGSYQPGHRVPPTQFAPAGLTWTLAVPKAATGPVGDSQRGNLTVHVAGGLGTTLLIRPDGYLAACGVPADPAAVLARLGDYAQGA